MSGKGRVTTIWMLLILVTTAFGEQRPIFPGCPADMVKEYDCAQYMEKEVLKEHSSIVRREKDGLVFLLANGSEKKLVEKTDPERSDVELFSLMGILDDIKYAHIHGQYYEWTVHYLLSLENGTLIKIKGYPFVSADRQYVASVWQGDIHSGEWMPDGSIRPFGPEILMYRIEKPQLILEESFRLNGNPCNPRWTSNTSFTVDLVGENEDAAELLPRKAHVALQNGKWVISVPGAGSE